MADIAIYEGAGGPSRFVSRVKPLGLLQMAELFGRDKSVISRHLRNVFKEGELERDAVVANFAATAADGKTYQVGHYNWTPLLIMPGPVAYRTCGAIRCAHCALRDCGAGMMRVSLLS